MSKERLPKDFVHWYMNQVSDRIVAHSGIPSDRFHLGKKLLQSFKDDPNLISQINGATGESETNASVLKRTIRCAVSMRNMGLKVGDVIIIMAPNHMDVAIPLYASLYLGIIIAAVDRTLGVQELQGTFTIDTPKIIFCQSEKAPDVQLALNNAELDARIVTFDKGDYLYSFSDFLDEYGDDTSVEQFRPNDFDSEQAIAFLLATSGTTGLPKSAAVTHRNFSVTLPYLWARETVFPKPTNMILVCSPLQWLTAVFSFLMAPILRITRLQSSEAFVQDHVYDLINTYKPSYTIMSPTLITSLLRPDVRDKCDFTCLRRIQLGGSAVPESLIYEIKNITHNAEVYNIYGLSELTGIAFYGAISSCGKPLGCFEYRLIDVKTGEDINEPNITGELWLKGPAVFKGYYKNSEATEDAFSDDGWFKTGDIFYRDDNYNYYFVERLKLLLKYKSYQISPVEVENVIRQHPEVLDAAVTGIPDPECGDLVVACIVPRNGCKPSAQEIKDLVKDTLSDAKQLRGGVIFIKEIPMTASTKIHRRKLRDMVLEMKRE